LNKRKFDIRCFALIQRVSGHLSGYFFEDGYIRTSSKEFKLNDTSNKYVHLTNDAIQKASNDYGKYENGNKLSFSDFDKIVVQQYPELNIEFMRDFLP
jgi:tubulin polyglutamylase TTLL1/tubulin monoglycylase TTLL3/8